MAEQVLAKLSGSECGRTYCGSMIFGIQQSSIWGATDRAVWSARYTALTAGLYPCIMTLPDRATKVKGVDPRIMQSCL